MLSIVPIDFDEAVAFVEKYHRHHGKPQGFKFCVAVADEDGNVRGVAIVARPVARVSDDGWHLEVRRCCTDGARNAPSMLYRSCWRAARALGYKSLSTYTLPEEGGASLRAAGFKLIGQRGGGSWSTPSRPRVDKAPMQAKLFWEITE